MSEPSNLLTVWAELLIDTLASSGVTDVVVSPGSRSTPFTLAAARNPALHIHPVIDERAAAFYALGLARVSHRPPVLLCTSGTAPAHYYPAVIEASESAIPLIVVSANRPHALSQCGAPQTIDQTRLFGSFTRFWADLGEPNLSGFRGLRRTVARAVAEARGPWPGPVHLDARADKPLEPCEPSTDVEHSLAEWVRSLRATPVPHIGSVLEPELSLIDSVAERIASANRCVIVAGPLGLDAPRAAILAFARSRGFALFAEASSQLRFAARDGVTCGDAFDRWIERTTDAVPDLVLEIGGTPTSAAYARWIERSGPRARVVLGGSRFRDPSGCAETVILGDLGSILEELTARLPERVVDGTFASAIETEERRAWSAVERALASSSKLEEGFVTQKLCASLPAGALLSLGNSLPIRHADRFVPGGHELRVLSQRGANGIDGAIASIAAATIYDGGPAALLVGDVTLAHDLSSLTLAARARSPLLLVVLDNDGGRIFEQLPIARAGLSRDEFDLFTTPPKINFPSLADAFGVAYEHAHDPDSLEAGLRRALAHDSATLLHVRVPPESAARTEARIDALLAEAR